MTIDYFSSQNVELNVRQNLSIEKRASRRETDIVERFTHNALIYKISLNHYFQLQKSFRFEKGLLHPPPLSLFAVAVLDGVGLRRGRCSRGCRPRDDGAAPTESERLGQGRGAGRVAGVQDQAAVLGPCQRRDPVGVEAQRHRAPRHQIQRHRPRVQEEQDLLQR